MPLAKGVNMSSLLYIFSTLQLQAKVYLFRGYPIPSHKFCGGGGRLLSIGQLPDAANAKALVRSYSAAAPCLAASSRCCSAAAALPLCGGAICIFATAPRQFCRSASASNIFPMALYHGCASHKVLRHGAPASNKPHPAEKSTPVWLAIWHIWAGFANSQLQCATFHSTYSYKFTSSLLPTCNCCSDIANLSAHLHRLPTPPPYLRRMRLPPGPWAQVSGAG